MTLWSKPVLPRGTSDRADPLEQLFQHVPVAMALVQRGVVVLVNRAFAALFGQPAEALPGRALSALFQPGVELPALPDRGSLTLETELVRRHGGTLLLELSITALESEASHVVSARELTTQRAPEFELGAQSEFLRTVIDTMPGFVFVKD